MTSIEANRVIDNLLYQNGRLRSNELKSAIVKKDGLGYCSERTFYKILNQKTSSGLIRKDKVSDYEIWYEWTGFFEDESKFEKAFQERLEIMDMNIQKLIKYYSKLKKGEKAEGILFLFNDLDYLETTTTMFFHSVGHKRSKVLRNLMEKEYPKRTKILLNLIRSTKEAKEVINLNLVNMIKNLSQYEKFITPLEKRKS